MFGGLEDIRIFALSLMRNDIHSKWNELMVDMKGMS